MIRSLWTARTGLDAHQTAMDVITNNLANVSTNGFKRSRAVFEDLLYQNLRAPGAQSSQTTQVPTGLQIGVGVRPVSTERVFTQGSIEKTENPLDLAIQGNGFFAIEMPDGSVAYTRDGAFTKDATGRIVTSNGFPLTDGITISADAIGVEINSRGQVFVDRPGQDQPEQVGSIQLHMFVNNGGLKSVGQNLFVETPASGAAQPTAPGESGSGLLNSRYVETSNVNVAEELVSMIIAQRGYEMNSKAITVSDQMLARLSQL